MAGWEACRPATTRTPDVRTRRRGFAVSGGGPKAPDRTRRADHRPVPSSSSSRSDRTPGHSTTLDAPSWKKDASTSCSSWSTDPVEDSFTAA